MDVWLLKLISVMPSSHLLFQWERVDVIGGPDDIIIPVTKAQSTQVKRCVCIYVLLLSYYRLFVI